MEKRLTRPAQEGIMTDEGCCLTAANSKANCRVDEIGEECDAVLEIIPGDLHDAS